MRARFRSDQVDGLHLVAQLVDVDVYLAPRERYGEMFVMVFRGGAVQAATDLRIDGIRLSIESQRFYTSLRDVEDLLPGLKFSRQDRP